MDRNSVQPMPLQIQLLLFALLSFGIGSCGSGIPTVVTKTLQSMASPMPTFTTTIQLPSPEQQATATPIPTNPLPKRPIYIVDPNDQGILSNIFMIDPDQERIVWTIQTRYLPVVVLSPDNQRLYVADSYRTQVTRGSQRDVLSVYDAQNGNLIVDDTPLQGRLLYIVWPLTRNPFLFLSDDGKQLFVEKYGDPDIHQLRLAALNATTLQPIQEASLPSCENRILAYSDRWICITNNTLFEINPWGKGDGKKVLLEIPGSTVVDAVLDTPSNRLFTIDSNALVNVVNRNDNTVIETNQLKFPTGWQFAREFVLSPDGKRLYVSLHSNTNSNGVFIDAIAIYDTKNWIPVARINFPDPVYHFALSSAGDQLYATSPDTRSLVIYDTGSLRQVTVIQDIGGKPSLILVPRAIP